MTQTERDYISLSNDEHILDVAVDEDGTVRDMLDVDEPHRYSPRQLELAHETAEIVAECGQFDQSWGPNGAYYVEGRDNPWQANGLNCANCVNFEGPRSCEWVAGTIDPDGLCRLSVIPADLVTNPPLASTASTAIPEGPAVTGEAEETEADSMAPRARVLEVEARKVNGRDREVRVIGAGLTVEERAADAPDGTPLRFSGYAAVFNSPSERLYDPRHGEFTETIAPGAFKRTLSRDADVRMYMNHNSDMVLASTRSQTLTLTEDPHGLRVDAELPDTTYARDLASLMRSGVVDSMSFGFTVLDDKWDGDTRELREVQLIEVSVVSGHPAYPETAGANVRNTDSPESDTPVEPSVPVALKRRYLELASRTRG